MDQVPYKEVCGAQKQETCQTILRGKKEAWTL